MTCLLGIWPSFLVITLSGRLFQRVGSPVDITVAADGNVCGRMHTPYCS